MKLWGIEGKRLANGWAWKTRRWTALVYDLGDGDGWVWTLRSALLGLPLRKRAELVPQPWAWEARHG